ncbi:hypothetical protein B0A55_04637 [Friedmanniomyces simplex]|uniref:Uncharacterized protein n=1 Tax=Friedmanniomyces simplex TaxID=329884 RepID=A0A4U0XI68_9PEZI|nr:hypothetical protein B0A55_04637 [Friedmanniomyces simplex]
MTLPDILSSFTTATEAAIHGLPESAVLAPPENGITLLDVKNEIFVAYLQALALRNLNVIRSIKHGDDASATHALSEALTKKLVEHRVYLERGVKPLEAKIKYQVDKVVKAADDEERDTAQKAKVAATTAQRAAATNEDGESDEDDDDSDASADAEIDALAYRPSRAAFSKPVADANTARRAQGKQDGVYRPPRISATAMPTPERREAKDRRPLRSATVDEYISTELSSAPLAEPSIGSTIAEGGRRTKDTRQLAKEAEKRNYEESNLVRLPKESKKDRLKKGGREKGGGFGGEEWRGLGESADRIGDLTRRQGGRDNALDKSRKRRPVEDRPRDSGIGDAFDVKRRRMEKKTRR